LESVGAESTTTTGELGFFTVVEGIVELFARLVENGFVLADVWTQASNAF
jgi:hypothetical protein